MNLARQLYVGLLDLLFPPFCRVCSTRLEPEDRVICVSCWSNLEPTSMGNFRDRIRFPAHIDHVLTGWYMNETLEAVIYGLKYHEKRVLGKELGERLADIFGNEVHKLKAEAVVPVPLHPSRFRERGFNQSDLMGKSIAHRLDLPYRPGLLRRIRNTKSQTELSIADRQENVNGAFEASDPGEHIRLVIVDDVLTSGATVSSCAKALKDSGAEFVATITAGTPQFDLVEGNDRW